MTRKNGYIGIFDSGLGGLEVMKNIVRVLPEYDYIYLGDTARVPYGSRSQEMIYKFTEKAVDFLFAKKCRLIIIACNTASARALRKIQQKYLVESYPDRRVLGVIIPTVEEAIKQTKNNQIGVIATESTVNSGSFTRELLKLNPKIKVHQQACPLLVPLVESDELKTNLTSLAISKYLNTLRNEVDVLILGCTHYGLLKNQISRQLPKKIKIISQGAIIAPKLKNYLTRHPEIETMIGRHKKRQFFTTDMTEKFAKLGSKFYGGKIKPKKANIE